MNKPILIVLLILAALPALCNGTDTYIAWPGWQVSSTENLDAGHKHTSFPLTHMLDGNPATTWVFSGTGKRLDGSPSGYAITLARERDTKPVAMDGIWIMNGYNKSRKLFLRNNRIVQLKLYVNDVFLKTVTLSDSMGWHKISIPRKPIRSIKLEFTKFKRGRDDDICISEIALYDCGKKVDLKMPKAVEFTEGNGDCGCGQEFHVIDRAGKRLAGYDGQSPCIWSPSGRYVAAAPYGEFWVADASIGKIIMRRTLFKDGYVWTEVDRWEGEHSVVVNVEKSTPHKTKEGEYETTHYTKTIKITGG